MLVLPLFAVVFGALHDPPAAVARSIDCTVHCHVARSRAGIAEHFKMVRAIRGQLCPGRGRAGHERNGLDAATPRSFPLLTRSSPQGVLVTCDAPIKSIIAHLDSVQHEFIVEDLDETHLVVKEHVVAELRKKLKEVSVENVLFLRALLVRP